MIDELEWLKDARPDVEPPSAQTRATARGVLQRAYAEEAIHRRRGPRWRLPVATRHLAPALALLVVVAVALVFLGLHRKAPAGSGSAGTGPELGFRAKPTAQTPVVTKAAVARAVHVMQLRADSLLPGAKVSAAGNEILVRTGPGVSIGPAKLLALAAAGPQLAFYDWEADALTPTGQTVASQLAAQNSTALAISQGAGGQPPGSPGAGSMSLYAAVKLASEQPRTVSAASSRYGPEYFLFGAPGSGACAAAAKAYGVVDPAGEHCYLAGPAASEQSLASSLPSAVTGGRSHTLVIHAAQMLVIQRGTVVLQAVARSFSKPPPWGDPRAQFYVLRDDVALSAADLVHPQAGTDQSGSPDVAFDFTSKGQAAFEKLTSGVSRRGDLVSSLGDTFDQHFAIALNSRLITVPSIDFREYPDGIRGNESVEITGGFTSASARELAAELRSGALPVKLELISTRVRTAPARR
jgi:hypothetical protein